MQYAQRVPSHTQALVAQRFETKYLISEYTAQMIIDYIHMYMNPDPMGVNYPVTSLYLDDDTLSMFRSSEYGEKNRYKLRLRSYSERPEMPVYAEVKRRVGRVILKTHVPVKRPQVAALLAGEGADHEHLAEPSNESHLSDLRYFRELQAQFQATPCATVRYQREAYISQDDSPLRITFDRDLAFIPSPEYTESIWRSDSFWNRLHEIPVVMEIKFADTYPHWVNLLIQRFNLERTSLAKYVECVRVMQHEQHIARNPRELLI